MREGVGDADGGGGGEGSAGEGDGDEVGAGLDDGTDGDVEAAPGTGGAGTAHALRSTTAATAAPAAPSPRPRTSPIMPTASHYAAAVPDDTSPERLQVLLVTGGVGAGKTSTAVEIGALLDARGEASSVIDLDQLCWITPAPGSGMSVSDVLHASLAAMLPVHVAAGARRLVLARLLLGEDDVDGLRGVLGGADVRVVELVAPDSVRAARIAGRDAGTVLAGHLEEIGSLVPAAGLADHVIATDGRSVAEVAAEALSWWDAGSP